METDEELQESGRTVKYVFLPVNEHISENKKGRTKAG